MFCNELINYAVHENSLNVIFVNWMSYQVGIVNDFPFSSGVLYLNIFHFK